MMKDGVIILNFARDLLVDDEAMEEALASGKVKKYVTDFPNAKTAGMAGVIAIPHLGASTEESEDNCAVKAAKQTIDYLENGNNENSVNYPKLVLDRAGAKRICVLAKGADIAKINEVVGKCVQSASATKGDYLYAVYDVDADNDVCPCCLGKVDGVIKTVIL